MSSRSISSRAVPATTRGPAPSLRATLSRVARLMWRSSERHSLYQVMLAAGHEEGLQEHLVQRPHSTPQR
ncbi:hypothetical protein SAMN05444168_6464 [Paraburkholderia phenazinium]|jgi:hypothetical protein|uniref:Uncharacterized protein n=1 Tax=Paraburkholderia phenazinium TaxID=60549 RepID=A0A1N6K9V6_9BURK|nr:hypothetical protein SAMN05444168_6464 [Paraburkholderia phenazinium]